MGLAAHGLPGPLVSVTGDDIADLAALDEMRRFLERLVERGGRRRDLLRDLVETCALEADIHRRTGDIAEASNLYQHAARRCEGLGTEWDFHRGCIWMAIGSCAVDDSHDLAQAHQAAANAIQSLESAGKPGFSRRVAEALVVAHEIDAIALLRRGEHAAALEALGRSEHLLDRLLAEDDDARLLKRLAKVRRERAECYAEQGRLTAADEEICRAMAILQPLASEGTPGLLQELATTDLNRANYLRALGRTGEAVSLLQRAIEVWERLIDDFGRLDLRSNLARAMENQGAFHRGAGRSARELAGGGERDRGVRPPGRSRGPNRARIGAGPSLVQQGARSQEGRSPGRRPWDSRPGRGHLPTPRPGTGPAGGDLGIAAIHETRGNIDQATGDWDGAVTRFNRAISIRTALLEGSGRPCPLEEARGLARAHANRGAALQDLGRIEEADQDYGRALDLQEELVHRRAHHELVDDLVTTYLGKAALLRRTGKPSAAASFCDRAVKLLSDAVAFGGRRELKPLLSKAHEGRALSLRDLGACDAALDSIDQALAILRQEVQDEPTPSHRLALADLHINRGAIQSTLGREERGPRLLRCSAAHPRDDPARESWAPTSMTGGRAPA